MTVNTTPVEINYTGNGSTTAFALPFVFLSNTQVKVYLGGVLQTSGYTITGAGVETGGTLTFSTAPVDGVAVKAKRVTASTQEINVVNNASILASTLEQGLDLAAMRQQEEVFDRAAADTANTAALALKLDKPVGVGFVAQDVDGDSYISAGTGGGDAALRTDLAAVSGAAIVGTTYGTSVQQSLDNLNLVLARYARDYPPFSNGVYYGDVWPSNPAGLKVACVRMSATLILARVFRNNIVDEYVFADPAGAGSDGGVAGGWQLVSWRGFVNGRVKLWLEQTANSDGRTITEFAIRIVNSALYTYLSGGETNNGAYRGYGHGGMNNTPANNQINLSGGGSNLQSTTNWPVGTRLYGSSLTIACTFFAKFYATATQAVEIGTVSTVSAAEGLTELISWQALIADVGWNDSYAPMHAVNSGVSSNRAKLAGQTAITLTRDGTQKGNWHTTTAAPVLQFYDNADPTVLAVVRSIYGPPLRKNGTSISPAWGLNTFGRVHVTDDVDFAKFRVFVASSAEVPASRVAWPMLVGDVYSTLAYRRTEYLPGGPE